MSEPSKSPTLSDRYWRLPWPARIGLVVIAALGALALIGQIRQASPSQDRAASNGAAATAESPAGGLPAGQIGEGVWLVGSDVQPGTYHSTGAVDDGYCMWSRHSTAAGGAMDNIIASDGDYDGQMVVTIETGDVLFRTGGCAPFAPIG